MEKILIIGDGPLKADIERQYAENGYEVVSGSVGSGCYAQYFLLADEGDSSEADMAQIGRLKTLTELLKESKREEHPLVHMMLRDRETMWMFLTQDITSESDKVMELYPFTMDLEWSRRVLAELPDPNNGKTEYPVPEGRGFVHMAIIGGSDTAVTFAIQTALACHYPNYDSKDSLPLRTRITMIDPEIEAIRDRMLIQYRHLFDNSCYRTIDVEKRSSSFHSPVYEGKRKDFVDVEWEFVKASISSGIVRKKLELWASSEDRKLTIVFCHNNDAESVQETLALPDAVFTNGVSVLIHAKDKTAVDMLRTNKKYTSVHPWGMESSGYDVTLPYFRMAKLMDIAYDETTDADGAKVVNIDAAGSKWSKRTFAKRFSNICNAMTIPSKMRSLGHSPDDWNRFYAVSENEVMTLARVEHNRWSVEELILGFRPCTDKETEEIAESIAGWTGDGDTLKETYKNDPLMKAHYDIRAYEDLRNDKEGDIRRYDISLSRSIPLIAKCYMKGKTE